MNGSGGLSELSAREQQVLSMTARGMTNREMAEQLHVTVHAIKFHLATIYRKLDVSNRTEATAVYLTHELPRGSAAKGDLKD
jgi:DNA-binding NarL/FixJ family response regulator